MPEVHETRPCPSCQKRLVADAKACPFCGWTSVKTEERPKEPSPSTAPRPDPLAAVANTTSTPQASLLLKTCPLCGSDEIRKVSAVYAEGARSQSTYPSVGVPSWSFGESQIAEWLSPPITPAPLKSNIRFNPANWAAGAGCLTFALVGGLLGGAVGSNRNNDLGNIVAFVGLILAIFVGGGVYSVLREKHDEAVRSVLAEKQMDDQRIRWLLMIWERLYYCGKCHTVHDPATGRTCAPQNLSSMY